MTFSRSRVFMTLLALALVAGTAVAAPAQEQREVRRTFTARDGMSIDLENLAGEVTVEGTGGGDIEIVATIHAENSGGTTAQRLLEMMEIGFDDNSRRIEVRANYPVDDYDRYRYPQRGRGNYNTQTRYQGERVRVTSRDDNDAVTLWVDFTLRVPAGVSVDVENSVGDVSASDLEGDFRADTGSGNVRATNITGDVEGDTGSGNVIVDQVTGNVLGDTGSGNIEVSNVRGNVSGDTGSGSVTIRDAQGGDISADTGSGNVTLERVSGDIYADTGSGNITGRDIVSGASVSADTGSGDVRLEGDMSGAREITIDTSSGDVELDLTAWPGMTIFIETGSGGIDVDLPDLQNVRSRRNSFRGTVGDGSCDVVIDTGSGRVDVVGR